MHTTRSMIMIEMTGSKMCSIDIPLETLQVTFTLRIIVTVAMTFRQRIRRTTTTTERLLKSKFWSWLRSRKRGWRSRSRIWSRLSCWNTRCNCCCWLWSRGRCGWIRKYTIVFASLRHADASRDRFVCTFLTAQKQNNEFVPKKRSNSNKCRHTYNNNNLPYKSGLTFRICITISFAKTEGKASPWTAIISLQKQSILSWTACTEVNSTKGICTSYATRHFL